MAISCVRSPRLESNLAPIERCSPEIIGHILSHLNWQTGSVGITNQADLLVLLRFASNLARTSRTMLSKVTSHVAMNIFCQAMANRHRLTMLNWTFQCAETKINRSSDRQDPAELRILNLISEITNKVGLIPHAHIRLDGWRSLHQGFPTATGYVLSAGWTINGLHAPSGSTQICFSRFYTSQQGAWSVNAAVLSQLGARLLGAYGIFLRENVAYQARTLDSKRSPSDSIPTITEKDFFPVAASNLGAYLGTQTMLYDPAGEVLFLYEILNLEDKTSLPSAQLLPYQQSLRNSHFFTWPWDMFEMNDLKNILQAKAACGKKSALLVNLPCIFIRKISDSYPNIRVATKAALDCMRSLLEQKDVFKSGSHIKELVTQDDLKKLAFLYAGALSWLLYSVKNFRPCSTDWIEPKPATLYMCINRDSDREIVERTYEMLSQDPDGVLQICLQNICRGWKKVELKDHSHLEHCLSEEMYDLWLLETPLQASEMHRILTVLPLVLGLEKAMVLTSLPGCYLPCYLWIRKMQSEEVLSKLQLEVEK